MLQVDEVTRWVHFAFDASPFVEGPQYWRLEIPSRAGVLPCEKRQDRTRAAWNWAPSGMVVVHAAVSSSSSGTPGSERTHGPSLNPSRRCGPWRRKGRVETGRPSLADPSWAGAASRRPGCAAPPHPRQLGPESRPVFKTRPQGLDRASFYLPSSISHSL